MLNLRTGALVAATAALLCGGPAYALTVSFHDAADLPMVNSGVTVDTFAGDGTRSVSGPLLDHVAAAMPTVTPMPTTATPMPIVTAAPTSAPIPTVTALPSHPQPGLPTVTAVAHQPTLPTVTALPVRPTPPVVTAPTTAHPTATTGPGAPSIPLVTALPIRPTQAATTPAATATMPRVTAMPTSLPTVTPVR